MDDILKKGLNKTEEIFGTKREDILDLGDLGELILTSAFANVLDRPGLSTKNREMVTVSFLIAQGSAPSQLQNHFKGALNIGVSPLELEEIIIQSALYVGFPKAINALNLLKEIL